MEPDGAHRIENVALNESPSEKEGKFLFGEAVRPPHFPQ